MSPKLRLQTIRGAVSDVLEDLDILFWCRAADGTRRSIPKTIVINIWEVDDGRPQPDGVSTENPGVSTHFSARLDGGQ